MKWGRGLAGEVVLKVQGAKLRKWFLQSNFQSAVSRIYNLRRMDIAIYATGTGHRMILRLPAKLRCVGLDSHASHAIVLIAPLRKELELTT
jgi:hypothetical protein